MNKNILSKVWAFLSLLAILNVIIYDFIILTSPDLIRIQFIPDDAFYYFQLAKNFTKLGYWTFDSGVSLTSGYHPLWAYILVLAYKVFNFTDDNFILAGAAFSSTLTIMASLFVWKKSLRAQTPYALMIFALIASSQSFLFNSISGLEWAITLFLITFYYFIFYKTKPSLRKNILLFVSAAFLSLARSDSGLIPFSIFFAIVIFQKKAKIKDFDEIKSSFFGLAGAVLGVGAVLLNNFVYSEGFLQSSAQMKLYWSQFENISEFASALLLVIRTNGLEVLLKNPLLAVYLIPVLLVIASIILVVVEKFSSSFPDDDNFIENPGQRDMTKIVAAIFCIIGYAIFYTKNGGVQNWYSVNLLASIFIVNVSFWNLLEGFFPKFRYIIRLELSIVVSVAIGLNLCTVYPVEIHSPWPHQKAMLAAGKYLQEHPLDGRAGSWNAGIIGYYQGGTIVNIDGLVNDSIFPFATTNSLPIYLEAEDVDYIIDFQTMLDLPYSARGGYNDTKFLGRLVPIKIFDNGEFPNWKYLTLYKIIR